MAAPSKNYRYSTNVQVAIDADTRLVIATGDPQPGNRNDCTVYLESGIDQQLAGRPAVADGGYYGVHGGEQLRPGVGDVVAEGHRDPDGVDEGGAVVDVVAGALSARVAERPSKQRVVGWCQHGHERVLLPQ